MTSHLEQMAKRGHLSLPASRLNAGLTQHKRGDTLAQFALRTRTAFTLIEMITVIALMGLALSLIGGLLIMTIKSDRQLGQGIQLARTVVLLAEQLRTDGHATLPDQLEMLADQKLVLQPDADHQIEYQPTPQGLERMETAADGSLRRRDLFRLPREAKVVWSYEEATHLLQLQVVLPAVSELHARGERTSFTTWPAVSVEVGKLARFASATAVPAEAGGPT